MKKIAIATDSNTGFGMDEAKEANIFVLNMPFIIDNNIYMENVSIDQTKFYELLKNDVSISTSQPSTMDFISFFEDILKDYDEVVFFPMSSGLSASCESATLIARDKFKGRVFVVDNKRISVCQRRAVMIAKYMADNGETGQSIYDYSMNTALQAQALITVDTLKYLKKGGRLTPMAAAIGTVLRIKPTLLIEDKKIDAYAKSRTMQQAKELMIKETLNLIEKKYDKLGLTYKDFYIDVAYSGIDDSIAKSYAEHIKEVIGVNDINISSLSLSVSCHIGPGALAIGIANRYLR